MSKPAPIEAQDDSDPEEEWVLLMPPRLAQSSFATLIAADCVFRPWHLEGRFGSRTHKDNGKIGIPVLSKSIVERQAKLHSDLQALLDEEGVEVVWKKFTPSNRAIRDPPPFDARIHPERAPSTSTAAASIPSTTTGFTYMDLFAGMGGFAVALDRLGGRCLLASEIDPVCRRLYAHNFPKAPLHGDIYEIQGDQLPKERVDLLVGGFPCQPFSALGEQPGIDCPKAGGLFLEIVRILKACQPAAFLLENVPGLLAMKETFQTIVESLQGAGYTVTYEVCNARGLTATSRKRLFLVGFLKTDNSDNNPPFEFPYVPDLHLRARHVIDYSGEDLSEMERQELPITNEQLEVLQKGKKWRPAHLAWPNTVCSTLVSHYGNSISRGHSQLVPVSATLDTLSNTNTNPRRFSPRECLRLMGFPTTYSLPLRANDSIQGDKAFLKEQYRMAGNAVCPPLIAALAGAALGHAKKGCHQPEWVEYGRQVAVELAYEATKTGRPEEDATTTTSRKRKAEQDGS